jgi:FKBP-type peptidyl-prolyl cis-trans isomerase SlyD
LDISKDTVVYFHYTLRNEDGDELETSRGSDPSAYLHGAGNIIPGLEEAMQGKSEGDVFSATVAPERAYGLRQADRVQRVPVKHLVFKGKLRPGMVAQLNTSEGRVPVSIVKTGRHSAEVDTNHPLAGQTLVFDIEVLELRPATAEEISHRHVHGPGGHQH